MTAKMRAEAFLLFFGYLFVLLLFVAMLRFFGLGWVTTCVSAPFLTAFAVGIGVALTAPRVKRNGNNH